jgi:26S proteasome regulatory subunit N5
LEEDGKADEATNIIQEIQIETYGSLEMKEKVEFILY